MLRVFCIVTIEQANGKFQRGTSESPHLELLAFRLINNVYLRPENVGDWGISRAASQHATFNERQKSRPGDRFTCPGDRLESLGAPSTSHFTLVAVGL